MYRKNTTGQFIYFAMINATNGLAVTGATVTTYRALGDGLQAVATGTVTELGNGQYRFNLSIADTNADYGSYLFTATGAVPVEKTVVFTAANPTDAVAFGLSRIDAAISSRMATFGLPTNFSSLAITESGAVTAGTVSDKTGYNLTVSPLTSAQTASAVWDALLANYAATGSFGARVLRTDHSSAGNGAKVTGSGHVAADIHELQAGVISSEDFATGAINSNALAADAVAEIAYAVAATQTLSRLDSMIESDGAGQFRFDTIALSMVNSVGTVNIVVEDRSITVE